MRLTIILFLFTISLVHNAECRWFPQIFEHFTNKTTQLSAYVKQSGRDLKKYYGDLFRNKINSYISSDQNETGNNGEQHQIGKKKLKLKRNNANDLRFQRKENTNEITFKRKGFTTTPKFKPQIKTEEAPTHNTYLPNIDIENEIYEDDECLKDNPIVYMSTPQLIVYYGYRAESHTVLTEDGYFLTLHRIPFQNQNNTKEDRRRTVLLHHGLLGSSADWVIAGPEKGLAFILSNAGYDVWMANVRGNTYSRYHISRPIDSYAFWNFTFHEVSQYDLPAIIDYIMDAKGWDIKINYIGHSMGTTVLFALLSTKTQYNKVLRAGYALAPVAYMTNVRSPIKVLAKFANNIAYLMKLLGANEFLPQNYVLKWLSKHACEINHYEEAICESSLFVLCGFDARQFNKTLLPIILSHSPAGASTKTLIHYAQIIHSKGRFQQFDYGADENLLRYGSSVPPEYPLPLVTLPIALISAENDWLSSEYDVTHLYVQIANPIENYIVPYQDFNHIDFLWAIDAPKLVYSKLLQLLEEGISTHSYFNLDVE